MPKKVEKEKFEIYPVLALRNTVLFPHQIIPIYIGRKNSLELINDVAKKKRNKYLVALAQKDGSIENPNSKELYQFGTLVRVMRIFDMPDNSKSAIVQGIGRVEIKDFFKDKSYYTASINKVTEPVISKRMSTDSKITNLIEAFNKLINLAPYLSEEQATTLSTIVDPGKIADRAVSFLNINISDKISKKLRELFK